MEFCQENLDSHECMLKSWCIVAEASWFSGRSGGMPEYLDG